MGELFGDANVLVLSPLVSTSEEHDQYAAALNEVHPVPRSMINPQLGNAFAHGFDITRVAEREPPDANVDATLGLAIAKGGEPLRVLVGLANLDHRRERITWDTSRNDHALRVLACELAVALALEPAEAAYADAAPTMACNMIEATTLEGVQAFIDKRAPG